MVQTTQHEAMLSGAPPESFGFRRINYTKNNYVAKIAINRPDVLNCFDMHAKRAGHSFSRFISR